MNKTFPLYASVILDVSIGKPLDYGVPHELIGQINRGSRVQVPVRGHPRTGHVFDLKEQAGFPRIQPIISVLEKEPLLSEDLFELAVWMARYYCCSLGDVLRCMLPSSVRGKGREKQQRYVMRAKTRHEIAEYCAQIRAKSPPQAAVLDAMLQVRKGILLTELLELSHCTQSPVDTLAKNGWLLIENHRVDRSPLINEEYFRTKSKTLTEEQQHAFSSISQSLQNNAFAVHLVYGITGSGKTEVYLQAIENCLSMGKNAIVLVPEISLTPQTIERFRSRFDQPLAILHHRLSHGERFDEWHRILRGEASIVIGARSAVFCPLPNLGMIVVDEEHEGSYKASESHPCYHARDLAVVRAKLTRSVVILGSATPSLESYQNALSQKYQLHNLTSRPDSALLPTIRIIDMKKERGTFSQTLIDGIASRSAKGEQSILFLNRRGYHTTLLCQHCQTSVRCQHCDVSLTFHKNDQVLRCHLCGFSMAPPPTKCPECQSSETLKFRGIGTELVEKALHAVLPDIRTLRIDGDTTKHKGSHQQLLRDFGSGKADVLVGTQMIAKGLHFPLVTLVGVLNADASLQIPDFRASETVFQLTTQVAGRAGRGAMAGEVVIQTLNPDNRTIQLASAHDYLTFFQEEMAARQLFSYPPFYQMAKVLFSGTNEQLVHETAEAFRNQLIDCLPPECQLHPVLPAGYPKVKDAFRFQFFLRSLKASTITSGLEYALKKATFPSSIKYLIDINPLSTF